MTADTSLHLLTGAYVADALPNDERRFFERHLDGCAQCAEEVAGFQEAITQLESSGETSPPPAMKSAVMAQIAETRQARPTRRDRSTTRRTHRPGGVVQRVMLPVAAAFALVAVVSAVMASNLSNRVDELELAAQQMAATMNAADAQFVQMDGPGGSRVRLVMSPQLGTAVFMVSGMEPAPHAHTYELWLIADDGAQPAGVFAVDAGGAATHLVSGDMSQVEAIGVTIEPEGGSPVPTTEPIMVVPLRS